MKALIWIIILILIGLGAWWFMRDPAPASLGDGNPAALQTETEAEIDLGEFQDKG